MTFDEVLARIRDLLQRQGCVSYRALKRRFDLDDDDLADVKAELIEAEQVAFDEAGTMLVWAAKAKTTTAPSSLDARAPVAYTPSISRKKSSPVVPLLRGSASR